MLYTRVKNDAWKTFQMNAGIIVESFNPVTGVAGAILGATTGGFTFNANPTFTDFGEDVDNAPPNTKQLKRLQYYDPAVSGTLISITPDVAKRLNGNGRLGENGQVIPTHRLEMSDFEDFWVIGDYSDKNEGAGTAGYVALHIMNALNTAGFQWTTGKDAKGQFAFDFHGHYDIENIDVAPFEIYVKAGTGEAEQDGIRLSERVIRIPNDETSTATLIAYTTPADATVTWNSSDTNVATVADGVVTPGETASAGDAAIITASISVDAVVYSDTCTVILT